MSQNVVNPYRYVVPAVFDICTGFTAEYDASGGDGYLRSCKLQATDSGDVAYLKCNLETATGTVNLGLYSATPYPDIRLGYTATTAVVAGVNTLPLLAPVAVVSGTDYWVSIQTSATAGMLMTHGNPANTGRYRSFTYGTPPNPFGTSLSHTTGIQLCMTS